MKKYNVNDYALNKGADGIVYKFVDGASCTVTLTNYIGENLKRTEKDFEKLKAWSDENYREQLCADWRERRGSVSLHTAGRGYTFTVPSAEDEYFAPIERLERALQRKALIALAEQALSLLTDIQRRRYVQYFVHEFSARKIAELEGVSHVAIIYSLEWAQKKICKFIKHNT